MEIGGHLKQRGWGIVHGEFGNLVGVANHAVMLARIVDRQHESAFKDEAAEFSELGAKEFIERGNSRVGRIGEHGEIGILLGDLAGEPEVLKYVDLSG